MSFKLKVFVTGKNKRIVKDVAEHCYDDRNYITIRCEPKKEYIFDVMHSEMPNAVIICAGGENEEEIRMYDMFGEAIISGALTVFVIADEKDKKKFMKYSRLKKLYFLSRPVSLFTLYEKLILIENELRLLKQDKASFIEEYDNPNDYTVYSRRRILVVDDDTQQLMQIKELLDEFYDVTVVKSGHAALKFLSKKDVDLILLDYVMPEMDGPDVLKAIRADEELQDIPIIFLTGVTEKSVVIETLTELMPQGYVVKPAKKSDLVAKIIDVIG